MSEPTITPVETHQAIAGHDLPPPHTANPKVWADLSRQLPPALREMVEIRLEAGQIAYGETWKGKANEDLLRDALEELADFVAYSLFYQLKTGRSVNPQVNRAGAAAQWMLDNHR